MAGYYKRRGKLDIPVEGKNIEKYIYIYIYVNAKYKAFQKSWEVFIYYI